MKKILTTIFTLTLLLGLAIPAAAADNLQQLAQQFNNMKPALILLFGILAVLAILSIVLTVALASAKRSGRQSRVGAILIMTYVATLLVLVCTFLCFFRYRDVEETLIAAQESIHAAQTTTTEGSTQGTTQGTTEPSTTLPPETEPPTEPPTEPDPTFTPEAVADSDPANWGIDWQIITKDGVVDSYLRPDHISFGKPEEYFALEGIATFRGNNFRNDAAYGTAEVKTKTLARIWSQSIGSLNGWPGSGWTGQPLVVRWDEETKAIMNLYEEKKSKEDLVEVVLATLDGRVYFYDLEDGSFTRDPINLKMNFKGSGTLDPRGYPIYYVGSGITYNGTVPRMYAISLIDGSILYQHGGYDTMALRSWTAYDSTPLVSGETDTLIWPGENGILYTVKLNTKYDKAAGTLTMEPDEIVRTRYNNKRAKTGGYWLGYECSAAAVGEYLYLSENGGMFFCIDLNTMELVWAQDTRDDSNSTPVFEWGEDNTGYIYTAPSLHWTQKASEGDLSVYKLNAVNGEIIWEYTFHCHTIPDLSGGVQGSPLMGREGTDLEGIIIYPLARTKGFYDGALVALDTETGEVVWERYMSAYTWSSPVGVYEEDGTAYVIICDSAGNVQFLDGKTGESYSSLFLSSNIEASPVVFENTMVIGARGGFVCGIEIQ